MNKIISILFLLISLGFVSDSYSNAICKDGWKSNSTGSGTCSWHGGVLQWVPKKKSTPSFGQDIFYDSSDNGVDRCKIRRYKETRKECQTRMRNKVEEVREELLKRAEKNPKSPWYVPEQDPHNPWYVPE